MELLVLSEARDEPGASASAQDMIEMTRAAGLVGCRVFFIPTDFSRCDTPDNALWQVPVRDEPTPAVWLGFILSWVQYPAACGVRRIGFGARAGCPRPGRSVDSELHLKSKGLAVPP